MKFYVTRTVVISDVFTCTSKMEAAGSSEKTFHDSRNTLRRISEDLAPMSLFCQLLGDRTELASSSGSEIGCVNLPVRSALHLIIAPESVSVCTRVSYTTCVHRDSFTTSSIRFSSMDRPVFTVIVFVELRTVVKVWWFPCSSTRSPILSIVFIKPIHAEY
jgi:hypothetical protein